MRSGKMREGSYLLEIRLKPEQMEDLFSEMGRKWEGWGKVAGSTKSSVLALLS